MHDSVYHDLAAVSMGAGADPALFRETVCRPKREGALAAVPPRCSCGRPVCRSRATKLPVHVPRWDFEPVGIGVQGVWLKATLADSANGDGYHFGADGKCAEIQLVAPQASSCAGAGTAHSQHHGAHGLTATGGIMSKQRPGSGHLRRPQRQHLAPCRRGTRRRPPFASTRP